RRHSRIPSSPPGPWRRERPRGPKREGDSGGIGSAWAGHYERAARRTTTIVNDVVRGRSAARALRPSAPGAQRGTRRIRRSGRDPVVERALETRPGEKAALAVDHLDDRAVQPRRRDACRRTVLVHHDLRRRAELPPIGK